MSKKWTFGQVRELPKDADETRIIPFVLSTPERDRYHTVLNQDNWILDNYRMNPVVGYMHNLYGDLCKAPDPDDVIGMGRNARVEEVAGRRFLIDEGYFEPKELNLKAEKIFRKLLLGTLSRVSVGFTDFGKGRWGQGQEAEGMEHETYYFEGQELLEWSVVNIPGNAGAGKRGLQFMRDNTYSALMFISRELGKSFTLAQISNMRIQDVLDLLDGKDLEIREKDPEKVRRMLQEEQAIADRNAIIEKQQRELRLKMGK